MVVKDLRKKQLHIRNQVSNVRSLMSSLCDSHVACTEAEASAIQHSNGQRHVKFDLAAENTVASIEKPTRADCVHVGVH